MKLADDQPDDDGNGKSDESSAKAEPALRRDTARQDGHDHSDQRPGTRNRLSGLHRARRRWLRSATAPEKLTCCARPYTAAGASALA